MKKVKLLILMLLAALLVALPVTALAASGDAPAAAPWVSTMAVVEAVAVVVIGFLASYFKTSATFRGFIAELIADAEVKYANAEKAGKIKMGWVIDQIYALIPVPLRMLFSRDSLETFVQSVFDQLTKYAAIQCDKAVAALQAKYNAAKKK